MRLFVHHFVMKQKLTTWTQAKADDCRSSPSLRPPSELRVAAELRRADDELMVTRIHRANVGGAKSSNYPQAAGEQVRLINCSLSIAQQ
jgi:hypothetical protein